MEEYSNGFNLTLTLGKQIKIESVSQQNIKSYLYDSRRHLYLS